ncbi:unnamed protein product, partial [Symbiodinium microadriaticum]
MYALLTHGALPWACPAAGGHALRCFSRLRGETADSLGSSGQPLPSLPRCVSALRALAGAKQWQNATDLLQEMRARGPLPDVTAVNATIGACSRAAAWPQAVQLLSESGL